MTLSEASLLWKVTQNRRRYRFTFKNTAVMDYIISFFCVLAALLTLVVSETARRGVETISSFFSHELYRVSSSVPKRLAFDVAMITFFVVSAYGQFIMYEWMSCGGSDQGQEQEDGSGEDGPNCTLAFQASVVVASLVVSFLVTCSVVKAVIITKKLTSGRQRSEQMEHYWRNVYPTERGEWETAAVKGQDKSVATSCFHPASTG